MTAALLRLSGVACMRGGRMLLRGIDLELEAGQSAMLRGPNGTGKSSLIRVAAGLLPAYEGVVEREGGVALCDENLALDGDLPLARALGFWTKVDRASSQALKGALDAMGLARLDEIPVRMLSTGQRKRAMLARVLASGAAIWMLDEPANGLDADSQQLLGEAIEAHLHRGGIVLAASHQPLSMSITRIVEISQHVPDVEGTLPEDIDA